MFFKTVKTDTKAIIDALNASQAVIEFTPKGDILTANDNFLTAVGYSLNEIVGRHHSLFCDPDYAQTDAYRRFWLNLGQGLFASGVYKRFGKGEKAIWLQATYNPVRDEHGKVIKVVKFASDITAAKVKELDFNGKMEAIDRAQAVIEFTPAGHILTANDNFLKTLGYALEEIAGKHHEMFCERDYVRTIEYTRFWEGLARGEFQAAEYKRIGKGGREVYIQATYNPIFDDTGAVVKVVKFATDVSETVHKRLRNDAINRSFGAVIEQISEAQEKATHASSASSETGDIINSVAAASEELSQSVRDITHSMSSARIEVEGVFKHAENANSSATGLNKSAAAMNNIVSMINDIAGQINLLALNATIESARAGDAGKGFAVVASEVKSLANQAARSTQTIAGEIATMQSVTNEVVGALNLISISMNAVLENVSSVASAMEQQNAVTSEITHNMQSAVTAVHEISDSLNNITHTFSRVQDASEQVKNQMDDLAA